MILAAAASIARKSFKVSSIVTAPTFSSSRDSLVVPGIGTIHGFWERDLSWGRLLPTGDGAEQFDYPLIRFQRFRSKTRQLASEVVAAKCLVCIDLAITKNTKTEIAAHRLKKKMADSLKEIGHVVFGSAWWARTTDTWINSPLLYRLS